MSSEHRADPRYEEYWDWVAVALFLLLSVDLLTSMYAAGAVGLEHEANPLMAWLLGESLAVVIGVHVGVLLVAATLFYGLFELVRGMPAAYRDPAARVVEAFLGLLVAAGLFVFANNLAVIVFGESLL